MLRILPRTLIALALCSVAFAEDAAALQKQIAEKAKGIKSLRCKMVQKMDMSNEQFKMSSESQGTMEFVRKSEKVSMMRMENKGKSIMDMAGQKNETTTDQLVVSDGEYTYSLTDQMGVKNAMKMKQPAGDPSDVEAAMKDFELKVLPEDKIDGKDCWVIEMTPKAGTPQAASAGKSVNYYRKDCGWIAKTVVFSAEGKPMMTMEYKDIEIDPTIDPSRFVFTAPPGVTVQEG